MKTKKNINEYDNMIDNKQEKSSLELYYYKNFKLNKNDGKNYEIYFLHSIIKLYKLIGVKRKTIYEYIFNRYNYINELNKNRKNGNYTVIYKSLLDKNKKVLTLINYINRMNASNNTYILNITNAYNSSDITNSNNKIDITNITYNYYQNLIRTEKKYKMYENFIFTNSNSEYNSNNNTLHLVLQGNALNEFLKQANRTLLITDENLKKISNSMYYLNNYSLDKVFKSLNITSADSLERFFKNKIIENNVFSPVLALTLNISKKGFVKNVNFNEIYFTSLDLSDKINMTNEFIYEVNKIIDRNVLCEFEDVKNYIQNSVSEKEKENLILFNLFGKNQNNIVYNKKMNKSCLKDQIIKEKDDFSYLYKSLNKFVNKISFIIDLLEELKVEDPVDKVFNNFKFYIDFYKNLYHSYQNCIKCKYDPLEYYNINRQLFYFYHENIKKMKNALSRPFNSKYYVEGNDFRIAGNENVSKSIIQYLSETPLSQNQIDHLIYNFLYLNYDYNFYKKAYKIIEVLGKQKLKKLLINRKQFYESDKKRNVFVQGVINTKTTISAISKIYFYKNGTNPLKTPLPSLNETSFLKNLIEHSEGSVPFGILEINSFNVQFELKKIYKEDKKKFYNLKTYIIDYINDDDYIQNDDLIDIENANASASTVVLSILGGLLFVGVLGGFAYFMFNRFFNKESSSIIRFDSISFTKDPTTTNVKDSKSPMTFDE